MGAQQRTLEESRGQSTTKEKGKNKIDELEEFPECTEKESEDYNVFEGNRGDGELPSGWVTMTPEVLSPATELLYQEWDGPEPYQPRFSNLRLHSVFPGFRIPDLPCIQTENIFDSFGATKRFLILSACLMWTRVLTMILVEQNLL